MSGPTRKDRALFSATEEVLRVIGPLDEDRERALRTALAGSTEKKLNALVDMLKTMQATVVDED